jgi:alpha-galactosidase/6-phospho-beta-glucosidase family protein
MCMYDLSATHVNMILIIMILISKNKGQDAKIAYTTTPESTLVVITFVDVVIMFDALH